MIHTSMDPPFIHLPSHIRWACDVAIFVQRRSDHIQGGPGKTSQGAWLKTEAQGSVSLQVIERSAVLEAHSPHGRIILHLKLSANNYVFALLEGATCIMVTHSSGQGHGCTFALRFSSSASAIECASILKAIKCRKLGVLANQPQQQPEHCDQSSLESALRLLLSEDPVSVGAALYGEEEFAACMHDVQTCITPSQPATAFST